MTFHDALPTVVEAFEVVGVAILAIGSVVALVRGFASLWHGARGTVFGQVRRDIGLSILLGLEVLIIADIVQTITIDPSLESAVALGIIVLVRTFLSFSLEIELDGIPPWRRGRRDREA